jgi:hypothetical protein
MGGSFDRGNPQAPHATYELRAGESFQERAVDTSTRGAMGVGVPRRGGADRPTPKKMTATSGPSPTVAIKASGANIQSGITVMPSLRG